MPRRTRAGTAVAISVRLLPVEKQFLAEAVRQTESELAALMPQAALDVPQFLRFAALQSAEARLGYSIADFVERKRRARRTRAARVSAPPRAPKGSARQR